MTDHVYWHQQEGHEISLFSGVVSCLYIVFDD